jgi:hypothetical protein
MTALARQLHPTYVQLDTLLAVLDGSNRKEQPLIEEAPVAPGGGPCPVRASTGVTVQKRR